MTRIICGVDVSSKKLDARIGREGRFATFENSPAGVAALAGFCREHGAVLAVMEATGGYEKQPLALLWSHGVEAAIVNPRNVRDFAKAMGRLEKTDLIDAGIIAWYGEVKNVAPTPLASRTQQRLAALVTRLGQLTDLKTAQGHQRRLVRDASVLATFTQVLAVISGQIKILESQIAELIATDPLWKALDRAFRSVKGVADRTVSRLMAQLPEIGTISNKAISKLVGFAPIANDSGNSRGKRSVRGGRSGVRAILFVVAEVVRRYDEDFANFRARLLGAGKPKKVVRVALAHKLLVRLNAKAREARAEWAAATQQGAATPA